MVDHFADATLVDFSAISVPARRSGQLPRQQLDDIRVADIIAPGTPDDSGVPVLAVIETSLSLNRQDARNALRRANMIQDSPAGLRRLSALPITAGRMTWSILPPPSGVTLIHYELPRFDIP